MKTKYYLTILVLFIVPLSGVSIDIYVPSLPAVSQYFHVTKNLSQLTITAYLLGLGLMQLFAGGISDAYGRKKPFIIAMMIYIMTTFFIPWSVTIYELIILRFVQGAALAMTVVPMRSVISDLFEGKELQKMMTYMTMAWSLGPLIAPAIGGYLQYYLGWKANFYFLGAYSFITLVLAHFFLLETSLYRHPFKLLGIVKRYRAMLFHQEYLTNILIGGFLFSVIALFGVVGPFFIQTVLNYSAAQFGRLSLMMGLAWFLGAMMNRFILQVSLKRKAVICFWLMLVVAFLMFVVALFYPITIYNIVFPMLFIFFCAGVLYPSYFVESVLLFRESSASANALFNSSAFFMAGIISGIGTFIQVSTELPFIIVLITLISTCLILHYSQTVWRSTKVCVIKIHHELSLIKRG